MRAHGDHAGERAALPCSHQHAAQRRRLSVKERRSSHRKVAGATRQFRRHRAAALQGCPAGRTTSSTTLSSLLVGLASIAAAKLRPDDDVVCKTGLVVGQPERPLYPALQWLVLHTDTDRCPVRRRHVTLVIVLLAREDMLDNKMRALRTVLNVKESDELERLSAENESLVKTNSAR